ncbi:hypothetical protein Agabi119p4_11402 [Agaricus bisporus var. burnettii]|uniref:Defective in cullin neddylation protein n=1 Tax=Agaricus bisporus var. burnettii TaxID=192524 RepID=A0A8H7BX77_AGABI|nr:hypothetical protein Agabi119p4_11402 [Agaricus bisporus var. burnettii]
MNKDRAAFLGLNFVFHHPALLTAFFVAFLSGVFIVAWADTGPKKSFLLSIIMPGKNDENMANFVAITGSTTREAKKYLEKYKRLDAAMDAYYHENNDSSPSSRQTSNNRPASTSSLTTLFNHYKDPDGDEITVDGTIKLCEDLGVDPEDVVMLAIAYELKSPRMGTWTKQGWIDGWKALRCDNIASMKAVMSELRSRLARDPEYFKNVYNHSFEFARSEGQRSLALETAQGLWSLLLPHGLQGGALSHLMTSSMDSDNDVEMDGVERGWTQTQTQLWFDFLTAKGLKGISRDTWQMFREFVRTIDSRFSNHDQESAWPSTFDEFVEYAKGTGAS